MLWPPLVSRTITTKEISSSRVSLHAAVCDRYSYGYVSLTQGISFKLSINSSASFLEAGIITPNRIVKHTPRGAKSVGSRMFLRSIPILFVPSTLLRKHMATSNQQAVITDVFKRFSSRRSLTKKAMFRLCCPSLRKTLSLVQTATTRTGMSFILITFTRTESTKSC